MPYDWFGSRPRPLSAFHVSQALRALDIEQPQPPFAVRVLENLIRLPRQQMFIIADEIASEGLNTKEALARIDDKATFRARRRIRFSPHFGWFLP